MSSGLSERSTAPPSAGEASEMPGRDLGKFVLVALIGRGGMGEVWKAWSKDLGREVAIKFGSGKSHSEVRRFLREARLVAKLHHPNVVSVFEVGRIGGRPFLVMPWLSGSTIDLARLDLTGKLRAMRDAALAVDYAHRQGIVHRDIKPGNIMVERGRNGLHVTVMDFGLASQKDVDTSLSTSGVILGTPEYMSPEQARGCPHLTDPRSDVYSLGATLYRLATGCHPFDGAEAAQVIAQIATGREPIRPRHRDLSVPRDVETIIMHAMEREPARRYVTAAALAEDLRRFLDGEAILARRPGLFRLAARKLAKRRGAVAAVVLSLAVLSGAWFMGRSRPAVFRAEAPAGRRTPAAAEFTRGSELAKRLDASLARKEGSPETERRLASGAIAAFRRAFEIDPSRTDAAVAVARVYLEMGRPEEAREWCGWALPDGEAILLRARIDAGRAFERRADPDAAEGGGGIAPDLESLPPLAGSESELLRGLRTLAGERPEEAADHLRRYLAEKPGDWGTHALVARILIQSGRAAEALEHADEAARARPRVADHYVLRGLARMGLNDHAGAVSDFTAGLDLDPELRCGWWHRATARRVCGDAPGALADYDRFLKLSPLSASGWNSRGTLLIDLGRAADATASLDRAILLNPNRAEFHLNRGAARLGCKDTAGAIDDFTRALELKPDWPKAFLNRGKARRKLGDSWGAIEDYSRAIAAGPEDAEARYCRGNARRDVGDLGGALLDFEEAIRLRHDYPEAHANLGLVYEALAARRPECAETLLGLAEESLKSALESGGAAWSYRAQALQWLARVQARRRRA